MSNGIDFVIGGKDKAAPAMSSVEKSLERLEKKTEDVGKATSRLANITSGLAAVYGTLKAGMALIGGVDRLNAAYDQQAEAVKGLEVALKLQGASVDVESARLQKFAGDMQKLTGVGDEVTLGLMQQASMLGVHSDQLDDAAKAAIGLSEASGRGLAESMKLVNGALAGEFGAFGEIIPAIKTMTTEEEKLAAVLEFTQRGLQAKAETSNTVAGMSERASGAIGDLMESVGTLLAPVRILISAGLKTLAESLQTVLVPAVEYANEMLANIGPLMDWVSEKVIQGVNLMIGAFTFFEVILTNLGDVWGMAVDIVELAMHQISGAVMHVFTQVIPGYAVWFGENFVNIMRDAVNLAYTVILNGITNIVDAFKAIWDFIASGGSTDVLGQLGEIAGRSYLEGFESSLTSLPEIAARSITDREKELAERIGQVGTNLADEFNRKMAERMVRAGEGIGDEFSKEIDLKVTKKVDEALGKTASKGGTSAQLSANESRMLTRGPADRQSQWMEDAARSLRALMKSGATTAQQTQISAEKLGFIDENMSNTTQLVPVL